MKLRTIQEEDLTALNRLYEELVGVPTEPDKMAATYAVIRDNPQYHLIGAFNGEGVLVGTVMGIFCYDLVKDCRPFMVVENVVVAAAHRGKGIGKMLMLELERIALERGCAYAMLVSGFQRKEAHRFYDAMGYGPDRAKGFKKDFR
jgi:GNAT superfamily N-acetyltransferase